MTIRAGFEYGHVVPLSLLAEDTGANALTAAVGPEPHSLLSPLLCSPPHTFGILVQASHLRARLSVEACACRADGREALASHLAPGAIPLSAFVFVVLPNWASDLVQSKKSTPSFSIRSCPLFSCGAGLLASLRSSGGRLRPLSPPPASFNGALREAADPQARSHPGLKRSWASVTREHHLLIFVLLLSIPDGRASGRTTALDTRPPIEIANLTDNAASTPGEHPP